MSHDEPQFGERAEANDPEALNASMNRRGYRPWVPGSVDEHDAKEIAVLAGKQPRRRPEPQPLGRGGRIATGVVLALLLGPFVLLLWHWALGVVGLL